MKKSALHSEQFFWCLAALHFRQRQKQSRLSWVCGRSIIPVLANRRCCLRNFLLISNSTVTAWKSKPPCSHRGYAWEPGNRWPMWCRSTTWDGPRVGSPGVPTSVRFVSTETLTVSRDLNSYDGTVDQTFCDAPVGGNVVAHCTATTHATRISVN
jgi:hypothetical protein